MIISGNVGIGTASPSNPLHGATNPATTNTVVDVLRLDRTTSGTAADGIGAGVVLYSEDASGNVEEAGRINAVFTTAAHATQAGRVDITAMGAATGVHVLSNTFVGVGTQLPDVLLKVGHGFSVGDTVNLKVTGRGWFAGGVWYDVAQTGFIGAYGGGLGLYHGGWTMTVKAENVIVGGSSAGQDAVGVLVLGSTATAPTTSVDLVHLYGQDISAGNRALAVYQESAVIVAAGIASTHKIPVKWNGTVYYLMASNV
jgi:hypothetical protein